MWFYKGIDTAPVSSCTAPTQPLRGTERRTSCSQGHRRGLAEEEALHRIPKNLSLPSHVQMGGWSRERSERTVQGENTGAVTRSIPGLRCHGTGDTEGPRREAGLQKGERKRPWKTGVSRELGLPSRGPGKVTDFTQEGSSGGRERKGWLGLSKAGTECPRGAGRMARAGRQQRQ